MGIFVVTGAGSGIGAATRAQLLEAGHEVIGADLRGADLAVDLGTDAGRNELIEQVTRRCPDGVDGVVAGAGTTGPDPADVTRVNVFGARATLAGLRPLVAQRSGAMVAISSNSCSTVAGLPDELVDACLGDDEDAAVELGCTHPGQVYAAGKLALARWVRREAPTAAWVGAGVRLNAIAPGLIDTPMMADRVDFVLGLGDVYPVPAGRAGRAEEIASLLCWMLGSDAGFLCGSVFYLDGGSDAALNAEVWPAKSALAQTWGSS